MSDEIFFNLSSPGVTFETMLKFNRLKQICDDAEALATAMRKSSSGLMEVINSCATAESAVFIFMDPRK